jgi:hypothetical protein
LVQKFFLNRHVMILLSIIMASSTKYLTVPVMGVEHHLLALTRIGPHEKHAAMAEPQVRDLHLGARVSREVV